MQPPPSASIFRQSWLLRGVVLGLFAVLAWTAASMWSLPTPAAEHQRLAFVDMHAHSTESDGDRSTEDQIKLAKKQGLPALWITDHDYIRDVERAREVQQAARRQGVTVGFGVEITVDWDGKEHHLLGYFPNSAWSHAQLLPEMRTLQAACAKVKASRETRNSKLIAHLNEQLSAPATRAVYFTSDAAARAFKPLDIHGVTSWAMKNAGLLEPSSLGRPHFLKFLSEVCGVNKELVFGPRAGSGVGVLLKDGSGVAWDGDAEGKTGTPVTALMHTAVLAQKSILFEPLPIVEAIALINAAGGRAVVAHMPTLGPEWASKFGPKLKGLHDDAGLWGVEAFSSEITEEHHQAIMELARATGLAVTGGSDNHGTLKSYAQLGDVHRVGTGVYESLDDWLRGGTTTSGGLLRGA